MRRLILFRHAKTEARPAGVEDFDRMLVERGRADSVLMGGVIAAAGFAPELAIVSPAARARETWELASPAFPGARCEFRPGLYEATPEEVFAELDEETARAQTVMVVGHNPSLQELAVNLLIESSGSATDIEKLSAGFPTAAAAVFEIDSAGRFGLEALFLAGAWRGADTG
ncbi:MAG TPA: histidine phosphatase family protein [Caulobacteraceae bacterium]|nr:histidine phosphatase family protein [Caulobacteraceae bacterium]